MSGVQEDEACYFLPVASLEAPDIDSRIGMTHQHKWPFFARGLQPCVEIVNYFIYRLQGDRSLFARAKIRMVIAANPRETGYRSLNCRPIFRGSAAGRNQDDRRSTAGFAIAVHGKTTISD